jgi:hypothetical protein
MNADMRTYEKLSKREVERSEKEKKKSKQDDARHWHDPLYSDNKRRERASTGGACKWHEA